MNYLPNNLRLSFRALNYNRQRASIYTILTIAVIHLLTQLKKITLLENNVVKNSIGFVVIASLALYAITIIQINLGLPIIR